MKRVINGTTYNTDTAEALYSTDDGSQPRSDFSFTSETIYKTLTGKYFLYGEGGPMTMYAKHLPYNSWGWGESIIPLQEDKVLSFMKKLKQDADFPPFSLPYYFSL